MSPRIVPTTVSAPSGRSDVYLIPPHPNGYRSGKVTTHGTDWAIGEVYFKPSKGWWATRNLHSYPAPMKDSEGAVQYVPSMEEAVELVRADFERDRAATPYGNSEKAALRARTLRDSVNPEHPLAVEIRAARDREIAILTGEV